MGKQKWAKKAINTIGVRDVRASRLHHVRNVLLSRRDDVVVTHELAVSDLRYLGKAIPTADVDVTEGIINKPFNMTEELF